MTQAWLTDEVSPLSAAQLNFRPAPDRWTVAEVVQHLVIAEPNYWKLLQDSLKQPPKKLDKQPTDADVLWYGIDRTQHDKTSADQNPKDQHIDAAEALKTFLVMHAQLLAMARSTNEDLRAHAVPDWGVDAYQCLSRSQRTSSGTFCKSARSKRVPDSRRSEGTERGAPLPQLLHGFER